jgi:DNA-binding FadR family transcriptional regulator
MPESSAERVAQTLRDDILTGRYRAGDRLPSERDLVEQLGVDRGAVREGLRALSQLGLVEVGPGGARAGRLEHASLDIVGYLLDLDDVPDATLVDQVLEVHAHLFSSAVKMAVARASDAALAEVRGHLRQIQTGGLPDAEYLEHLQEAGRHLVDASGNFVLRLLRRALDLQFWERLDQSQALAPPQDFIAPLVGRLDRALAERDARQAQDLVFDLMTHHRKAAVEMLSAEQTRDLRTFMAGHLSHLLGSPAPAEVDRTGS